MVLCLTNMKKFPNGYVMRATMMAAFNSILLGLVHIYVLMHAFIHFINCLFMLVVSISCNEWEIIFALGMILESWEEQ